MELSKKQSLSKNQRNLPNWIPTIQITDWKIENNRNDLNIAGFDHNRNIANKTYNTTIYKQFVTNISMLVV